MAKKRVAVVFADSHLRERTWADHPRLQYDSYVALMQVFAHAVKYEIPVIGAGDLIDKARNPSGPIAALMAMTRLLEGSGLPFYFIQGQHEMSDTPWLATSSWPIHIHGKTIKLGPFNIYGLDFQPADRIRQAFDDIPEGTDILVAHQVWSEFMGSIAAPQGSFRDVPHVSMVVTGDYHGDYVNKTYRGKNGQKMRVVNPGATCMQAIDEPPEKYFVTLYDDGSVTCHLVHSRPFIELGHIQTQDELEEVLETIQARISEAADACQLKDIHEDWSGLHVPIVRLAYSPRLALAGRRFKELVGDEAHLFLREIPPDKPEVQERRRRRQEEGEAHASTLLTELPGYLDEKDQRHLLSDCQRLITADDVTTELARMQEEALSDDA